MLQFVCVVNFATFLLDFLVLWWFLGNFEILSNFPAIVSRKDHLVAINLDILIDFQAILRFFAQVSRKHLDFRVNLKQLWLDLKSVTDGPHRE